ncbi:LysR family transcriptional regulator [Microbulbifer variabilis]|uniref:LysR family transcriptional regulator n=1 Tax=Microbulbifer variabilis TaxID=266805 RepID=UPI001CFF0A28|nr:LysR family transcriptional regulator [Microbulbifer variabilis]
MKPSLEDMQIFLAVVEARSFTAAADKLVRTKSAISQAVTRLEEDLGTRLLYRSTRSLSLTETGTQFYAHCREIRDIYNNALADLKSSNKELSGMLTITAPHALCEPVIVPAIRQLNEQHPQLGVRLLADDVQMNLIDAQVDLAVRVGNLDMQSAKVSKLGILRESLYASRGYIEQQGGVPEDLTELLKWQHIINDWQGTPVKYQLDSKKEIRVIPKIRCNSLHDILQMTTIGLGIARLPDIIAAKLVREGLLRHLATVASTPVHYMHLFSKRPPPKVQHFTKILRTLMSAYH